MRKAAICILMSFGLIAAGYLVSRQNTRQITLGWDPMPAGETWLEVRLYDISPSPEGVLLATAKCTAGPPVSCPVTATFLVAKQPYTIVARSWNGDLESVDSNTVTIAGPPKPPANLQKK